jgi:hypothetical protein
MGFNYAQPFLIKAAISYIQTPVDERRENNGYGLVGATVIIYLGISVSYDVAPALEPQKNNRQELDIQWMVQLPPSPRNYHDPGLSSLRHLQPDSSPSL